MDLTPLLQAAREGDINTVRELHKKGTDLNKTAKNGTSALVDAAANSHEKVVRYLVENGADPNLQTSMGGTALSRAAGNGDVEIIELLKRAGARTTGSEKNRSMDEDDESDILADFEGLIEEEISDDADIEEDPPSEGN